ncbi:MAG: hypothetical protein ABJC09_16165 [Terriglobia bacterium]
MSLMGYLTAGRTAEELRMPRGASGIDGLAFEGPVLNGLQSVAERRAEIPVRMGPLDREVYRNVRYYDPVLRAHCRL